jgi:hypothetical protein
MKLVIVGPNIMTQVGGPVGGPGDALIVLPGTSAERVATARADVKHQGDIYHCQVQRRVVFEFANDRVSYETCGDGGFLKPEPAAVLLKRMADGMIALGMRVPNTFKWEEDCLIDNGIITTKYGVTING